MKMMFYNACQMHYVAPCTTVSSVCSRSQYSVMLAGYKRYKIQDTKDARYTNFI